MMAAQGRTPFDTGADRYYFPCWTWDSEMADGPDPDPAHRDLQNSWFSFGLHRRKPHIQSGAEHGPASADEPLTSTERWLRAVGHSFTTRIHCAPPTGAHLYRGMTVPEAWISTARHTGMITLPLSSFDVDSDTAAFYATDGDRPPTTRASVVLDLAPGARAYAIARSEHLTHGTFAVHRVRRLTATDFSELIGDSLGASGTPLPIVLDIHQRSVPTPVHPTHHNRC